MTGRMAKLSGPGKVISWVLWAIILIPVGVVLIYLGIAIADGYGFGPHALGCNATLQEVISTTPGVARVDVDCRQYPTYATQSIVVHVAASDELGVHDTATQVLRRLAMDPRVDGSWHLPKDYHGADGRRWGELTDALGLEGSRFIKDVRLLWGIEPK